MSDDLRTRIATTLYGDGNDMAWARAVELADLLIWEFGLRDEWTTRESLMLGIVKLTKPHDARRGRKPVRGFVLRGARYRPLSVRGLTANQ